MLYIQSTYYSLWIVATGYIPNLGIIFKRQVADKTGSLSNLPEGSNPGIEPRDQTHVFCTAGGFLTAEPPAKPSEGKTYCRLIKHNRAEGGKQQSSEQNNGQTQELVSTLLKGEAPLHLITPLGYTDRMPLRKPRRQNCWGTPIR